MMHAKNALAKLILTMLLLLPNAAEAVFRAYLAADGNDANPCTLSQPCRLLPAALVAADTGGEIWMLDSANYNTGLVTITKSVTILAVPGQVGSIVATGSGNALTIDAAGAVVTLRNLVIIGLGTNVDGVEFKQGSSLLVEGCEIANITGNGIRAGTPGGRLTVKDTTIRNIGSNGLLIGDGANASLDNVHVVRANNAGVFVSTGSIGVVSNSVISASYSGVAAFSGINLAGMVASGTAKVVIKRSMLTLNSTGVSVSSFAGAGAFADAVVSDSTFTGNTSALSVQESGGGVSTITADNNTVTGNGIGFSFPGSVGTIYTRGNNTVRDNSGGNTSGGVLVPLASM